jgi:hypothetical protein
VLYEERKIENKLSTEAKTGKEKREVILYERNVLWVTLKYIFNLKLRFRGKVFRFLKAFLQDKKKLMLET